MSTNSSQTPAVVPPKRQLPTLQELHHDIDLAVKNDGLSTILNGEPKASWVKTNPYANNTKYLPIEKVEYLLARIFQRTRIEVLKTEQLFNAIAVTVRVHYVDPVSGEWDFHDGVGAVGVQTDAGKSASDLNAIKQNAVQMGLPAAKSYAIKDACEHLGKLFGRDLNRKETLPFEGSYNITDQAQAIKEAMKNGK